MSNEAITDIQRKAGINWPTCITMVVFHVGAVAALFMFSWEALAVSLLLWWVSGSLGVGMGFHRLLTHRGYKTPKAVEYLLTFCGLLALEAGPIAWVVTHRIHHAHADAPGDPHTPRDGNWWAHMGWILTGTAQRYGREVRARYAPDLMRDPAHRWFERLYYVPIIALGVVLLAAGGWPMLFWGVFLRVTFNLHTTWLVNSATHLWGGRRFETGDDSRNSWWVALLTWGEGWHNNHHAHPPAARHGLAWYEVDVNWWGIRALELLGLAKDVKLISAAALAKEAVSRQARLKTAA
ncbi:MAG TPA: fatty acid desaturase [Pyrinomonadaceae bacterium]|nr:fatty acid desaturase [Pyrinomonadaceae bacterium]